MKIKNVEELLPDPDVVTRARDLTAVLPAGMNLTSVDDPADFFLLTFFLSAQKKAPEIEDYLRKLLKMDYVRSSEDRGDACKDGLYYEFKTSTTNFGRKLNLRQIRPWQPVDFYICSYIEELNLASSMFFLLDKDQMLSEVDIMGGFTHGTTNVNHANNTSEYSITVNPFARNNVHTQRWLDNYWYQDLYDLIAGSNGE